MEDGEGCLAVDWAYFEGKGVEKDLKNSLTFYAKSCDLKFGRGCAMVGGFYHYGVVVKKNIQKTKEFYGIACDLGEQDGCDEYKKLNEKGY